MTSHQERVCTYSSTPDVALHEFIYTHRPPNKTLGTRGSSGCVYGGVGRGKWRELGLGVGVTTLRVAVHSCSARPFVVSSFRWPDKSLSSVTR